MRITSLHFVPARRQLLSKHQRGGSLIEVLVSLVLVAFGFLGMAGLFNYSNSANKSASSRLTASLLAQDYSELARANPEAIRLGQGYDWALPGGRYNPSAIAVQTANSSNICVFPTCTATSLSTHDKEIFANRVKALLPAGEFVAAQVKDVAGNFTNEIDIWIIWNEGKAAQDTSTAIDACPPSVNTAGANRPDPYPRCLNLRIAL